VLRPPFLTGTLLDPTQVDDRLIPSSVNTLAGGHRQPPVWVPFAKQGSFRQMAVNPTSNGGSTLGISQLSDQCEQLIYAVTTSRD
jgi:hypothetical protein